MSVNPDTIQLRVTTALTAALAAAEWLESTWAYPMFPGNDAQQIEAQAFAVGILGGPVLAPLDRQRLAGGVLMTTVVGVRFTSILREEAHAADYRAALAAERAFVAAVLTMDKTGLDVRLAGIPDRNMTEDGRVYLGEVQFEVRHFYPLS